MDEPTPMAAGHAGCAAMTRRGEGQWRHCDGDVIAIGRVRYEWPRPHTVWAFTCRAHLGLVEQPEPLTDEDRAELDGRRVQQLRAMAGLSYERPGPLRSEPVPWSDVDA